MKSKSLPATEILNMYKNKKLKKKDFKKWKKIKAINLVISKKSVKMRRKKMSQPRINLKGKIPKKKKDSFLTKFHKSNHRNLPKTHKKMNKNCLFHFREIPSMIYPVLE